MRKSIFIIVLLAVGAAGFAEAGQFRIAPPANLRKRQPPPGRRESRLEIVNRDDRGYAIDVDYRKNRLTFEHRSKGDIYIPGNSSITLVFDDDDDWRIYGDHESLNIEIRAGRTTTLRLETKMNRRQIGLFATVDEGRKQYSKQLFKYAERPGNPAANHKPAPHPVPPPSKPQGHPQPHPAPIVVKPQPPQPPQPPHAAPNRNGHGREPSRGGPGGDRPRDERPGHKR